jgi:hypothetical protein
MAVVDIGIRIGNPGRANSIRIRIRKTAEKFINCKVLLAEAQYIYFIEQKRHLRAAAEERRNHQLSHDVSRLKTT